jgi:hypothetical protein
MLHRLLYIILLIHALSGEDLKPGIYISAVGDQPRYLTIDAGRLCMQDPAGAALFAMRLVRHDGLIVGYRFGTPEGTGAAMRPNGSLALTYADGTADVFAPCAEPPEAVGWAAFDLPPAGADPARTQAVAKELIARYRRERQLEARAQHLMGETVVEVGAHISPEVLKASDELKRAVDENRAWLTRTLRDGGAIGRRTHGAQAHQVLMRMIGDGEYLRLSATVLQHGAAESKDGVIAELRLAQLADSLALHLGEPMAYGTQTTWKDTQAIIPVIADAALLEANRARLQLPPLSGFAQAADALIVRVGEDGRAVRD